MRNKRIYITAIFLTLSTIGFTQGDGARMLLWAPTGVTGIIPKWMSMDQNITPANILVKGANVNINAFPITVVHNFGIKGRFAQVMVNAVPGDVSASFETVPNNAPIPPNLRVSSGGFADGFVGFKLGLINQPALNVKEYVDHTHKTFSMMGYFRLWYSGSYEAEKPINLGSNRLTFELGLPMNIYLSKRNPQKTTWLEVYPAIHLFTENSNPTVITQAETTQQLPLFTIENHLSHNFTKKFWGSVDLRYQYGGELKADEVKQDNQMNVLGGGVTLGYQMIPPLGINMSYGDVFNNASNVQAKMLKLSVVFSYVNMKKLSNN
jgi:hypothetical protein